MICLMFFKQKDEILFFSLDKIIIKTNTYNPYKNISERMVLFCDRKTNCLTIENSFNEKILMEMKKNNK